MTSSVPSIPKTSRLPFVGNAMDIFRDPVEFVMREYHENGEVFEAKVMREKIIFFAGIEANQFFSRHANDYLSAKEIWSGYARNFKSEPDHFLLGLEGQMHADQRRLFMAGFSPKMLQDRYKDVSELLLQYFDDQINLDGPTPVLRLVQRLIMEELGVMCANTKPGDYYQDLVNYIRALLNVYVVKAWPKQAFLLPKLRKSRRRSMEFADQLIETHRQAMKENPDRDPAENDLIDDLINAYDSGFQDFTYNDLKIVALSPFSAGMDTVTNIFSTTLYILASHPDVMERVQKEVDEQFTIGESDMNTLRNLPFLHAVFLEVLRLYPVAPYIPRTVVKSFNYNGYNIPEGSVAYLAQVVPHFLEDVFENPRTFDPDRFLPPREEHKQKGAFSPYGLGAHKCLGLRLGEVQMMYSMCHLLKRYTIELESPDYVLQTRVVPTIGPKPSFKLYFKKR